MPSATSYRGAISMNALDHQLDAMASASLFAEATAWGLAAILGVTFAIIGIGVYFTWREFIRDII